MPSQRERILDYLRQHSEGVDDDALTKALGLRRREQANMVCNRLARQGLVTRQRVNGKLHNFPPGVELPVPTEVASNPERPWSWEGHVQAAVVSHLESQGYVILRQANTATHEPGKDIEARMGDRSLWVTVKGYPNGTPRTSPSTQATVWFKEALFDIVVWRGQSAEADLWLALPDFPRYHNLLGRVAWLRAAARFSLAWVAPSGTVTLEKPDGLPEIWTNE